MRGRGSRDQVVSFDAELRAEHRPAGGASRGLERVHVGWRPAKEPAAAEPGGRARDRDVIIVSHWASAEAAAGEDVAQTSPFAIATRNLGTIHVAHFEVDDTIRRHSNEDPVAIRLATGTFSKPGADAEMQNLLRQRAPLIDDDMAEAWVGRRMTGRAVEVTFVSAWRRLPPGRPLDEAFWPDIALRYDQFVVEVYSAVGVE
jgi:hypothetical protein